MSTQYSNITEGEHRLNETRKHLQFYRSELERCLEDPSEYIPEFTLDHGDETEIDAEYLRYCIATAQQQIDTLRKE